MVDLKANAITTSDWVKASERMAISSYDPEIGSPALYEWSLALPLIKKPSTDTPFPDEPLFGANIREAIEILRGKKDESE